MRCFYYAVAVGTPAAGREDYILERTGAERLR
jgi:hypothetical protein